MNIAPIVALPHIRKPKVKKIKPIKKSMPGVLGPIKGKSNSKKICAV
jgi:hypothetical protein